MAICSLLQNRPSCPPLKSAVLSHFKIGDFVSFSRSAILSHFRDPRFCLIFEIGGFVSFKIGCFVLPPISSGTEKNAIRQTTITSWNSSSKAQRNLLRLQRERRLSHFLWITQKLAGPTTTSIAICQQTDIEAAKKSVKTPAFSQK